MYKFASMKGTLDADGRLLPDIERQFWFGNIIRHLHIDELPQLINILKGELSLVGPRPLLIEYLPYYTDEQNKRHQLKPGLTGLSQAAGGNRLNWDQRLRYDVFYVENCSPGLDLLILFRSVRYLLTKPKFTPDSLFSESFIDFRARTGKNA